ncbi:hypothetical protein [Nannocystis pusilla]|uniref:hypothetical protein n=1 Tax=Nannocystis pusilla TaxID=889268 RepID=UPI003B761FA3
MTWRGDPRCAQHGFQDSLARYLAGATESRPVRVSVDVRREAEGRWSATLDLEAAEGRSKRTLRGRSCAEVGDAAAFVTAVVVDPGVLTRPAEGRSCRRRAPRRVNLFRRTCPRRRPRPSSARWTCPPGQAIPAPSTCPHGQVLARTRMICPRGQATRRPSRRRTPRRARSRCRVPSKKISLRTCLRSQPPARPGRGGSCASRAGSRRWGCRGWGRRSGSRAGSWAGAGGSR